MHVRFFDTLALWFFAFPDVPGAAGTALARTDDMRKNDMKLSIATTGSLALLLVIALMPRPASGQYVGNMAYCLSVDTNDTVGSMAFLVNSCSEELKVTYCFGSFNCRNTNGTGATSVGPRDRRTIYYDHSEYPRWSLIAFACSASVDFSDCREAKRDFFRNRNPDGPRR